MRTWTARVGALDRRACAQHARRWRGGLRDILLEETIDLLHQFSRYPSDKCVLEATLRDRPRAGQLSIQGLLEIQHLPVGSRVLGPPHDRAHSRVRVDTIGLLGLSQVEMPWQGIDCLHIQHCTLHGCHVLV